MSSYILDIVKNPIFIGLFGAIITYSYFYWTDKNDEIPDNKKRKKSNTTYHILVSLCVGLILGFGSYIYFDMTMGEQKNDVNSLPIPNNNSSMNAESVTIQKNNSINIPPKNLVIPQNLPDVFIETFDQ